MVYRFQPTDSDCEQRLDVFLHGKLPDYSRTQLRKIIDLGGVHIDGKRVRKCGFLVRQGLSMEVHTDQGPLDPFRLSHGHVLYQDAYMIALNKPPGVETQPTPARYKGTLYEALQVWLSRDRRFGRKLEIGMLQRLDRETSGVILFSIHPRAHKPLNRQVVDRSMQKHYLALVQGVPTSQEGEIRSFLAKDRRTNRVKTVPAGGKEAITRYRIRKTFDHCSLLEVQLITGRMHQIRAHLSEADHPLVGDRKYGGPTHIGEQAFLRQCLHSWRLGVCHPVSGEPMTIEAPYPQDMLIESSLAEKEIGEC